VVVVDIKHLPTETPTIREIREIEQLKEVAAVDVPEDVVLRLFLVEDVTAPVIEVLGSTYHCYPGFFQAHMQTIASREHKWVGGSGISSRNNLYRPILGKLHSLTEMQNLPFFSFPFRRRVKYNFSWSRPMARKPFVEKRTMARGFLVEQYPFGVSLEEERVTGILQDIIPGKARIGEFISKYLALHMVNADLPKRDILV